MGMLRVAAGDGFNGTYEVNGGIVAVKGGMGHDLACGLTGCDGGGVGGLTAELFEESGFVVGADGEFAAGDGDHFVADVADMAEGYDIRAMDANEFCG